MNLITVRLDRQVTKVYQQQQMKVKVGRTASKIIIIQKVLSNYSNIIILNFKMSAAPPRSDYDLA